MNEKVLISQPPYNLQRIIAKICITIGKQPLLPPKIRLKMLKWGGKNWECLLHWIKCGI